MYFKLVSILIILNLSTHVESIIDGEKVTEPHKFPWIVQVYIDYIDGDSTCGGSIISDIMIMTAAHCVNDPNSNIIVEMGHSNLTSDQIRRFQVEQIISSYGSTIILSIFNI